jgi:hypothetical protein
MMIRLSLISLIALSGCFSNTGDDGHADFKWELCLLDCGLNHGAMAAGGAEAAIQVTPHSGQPSISKALSSDPTVVAFAPSGTTNLFNATSGNPGTADLILQDGNGHEIDRTQVTVKATTELAFDHAWADGTTPMVLAGAVAKLHTTTKNGGDTLVGTGAVKFTPSGTIAVQSSQDLVGDTFEFTGTVGNGAIAGDCNDAHIVVPLQFVDASAITSVTPSVSSLSVGKGKVADLFVTVNGGANVIFDALCSWTSQPAGMLSVDNVGGGVVYGTDPAQHYQVQSSEAGKFVATCTVPGGKSTMVVVTVD